MQWTDLPEWPALAGGCLGVLAAVEQILRFDSAGAQLSAALALGLGATVPVALLSSTASASPGWAEKAPRVQAIAATAVIVAATLLALLLQERPPLAGPVALGIACLLLGRLAPARTTALVIAPLVVWVIVGAPGGDSADRLWAVLVVTVAAGAAGLGNARRTRALAAERARSRQDFADSLLEHAARGERARIARELHDVVAHHISMIAVQAETARLATPGMPQDGAKRLLEIGDTARAALTEMRRLLGVLREDAGPAPVSEARQPQPGLQQLTELIDEARESTGASTRLIVRGHVAPLDPGVELTAYRIVQEALTNARRHAPGAAVDVELDYSPDSLRVRIRDNGPGPAVAKTGHGLLGMRERAATVGGELRTGRSRDGGFVIEARLPAKAAAR